MRLASLNPVEVERIRGGGWSLAELQKIVDQLVLHYDACGVSKACFRRLHDERGLSVHFLLDIDGTVYQTLDLKECAWHAAGVNDRSIGIEIANIGAYAPDHQNELNRWYRRDSRGGYLISVPSDIGNPEIWTPNFEGRPSRPTQCEDRSWAYS